MGKKPKVIKVTTDSAEPYNADQAVRNFLKSHNKNLTDEERTQLGKLLKARAQAFSKVLGVEIGTVAKDD